MMQLKGLTLHLEIPSCDSGIGVFDTPKAVSVACIQPIYTLYPLLIVYLPLQLIHFSSSGFVFELAAHDMKSDIYAPPLTTSGLPVESEAPVGTSRAEHLTPDSLWQPLHRPKGLVRLAVCGNASRAFDRPDLHLSVHRST